MLVRTVLVAVVASGMLLLGLPLAGADVALPEPIPPTVSERMGGLAEAPAADRGFSSSATGPVESLPSATPIPFSMIGFEVPEGAEALEFRTSEDGTTWTAWVPTEVEHASDGPEGEELAAAAVDRFTEPMWVGRASHVQVRIDGGSPRDVGVHLIDSSGLGRSLVARAVDALAAAWVGTPAPAAAAVTTPAIVTRAQWGADESMRRGAPSYAKAARAIIVHHTAGSNDYSKAEAASVVRGIYRYHTQSLGWSDVGYNVLIDRFGTVYEGRHGGLDRPVVGAHAGGYNTGTVGVSLMGQHDTATASPAGAAPTSAALAALADVVTWKADLHHIDPKSTVTIGGSGNYAAKTVPAILGHRDVGTTACPGNTVYRELAALRDTAARRIGDMFVQPQVSPANLWFGELATSTDPIEFSVGLTPAGSWTLRVTDEAGTLVHQQSGSGSRATATWRPPAVPAVYRYAFTSSERRPVQGEVSVLREVVKRVATSSASPGASVELSKLAFEEAGSAEHAVVARSDVFADAMSGGPLAGSKGPLLLTPSGSLDAGVRGELERVLPKGRTIYILGGTTALSEKVADALAEDWEVERLSGPERTATAAEVAETVLARSGARTAMVARAGPDTASPWADALAGGAYGAREGIPVLLTPSDSLSPATKAVLGSLDRTIVLGGTTAISDAVARQLPNPQRVSGPERTSTSVAIARQLWGRTTAKPGDVFIVGEGHGASAWALALTASPLAAREGAPLLLTGDGDLADPPRQYLEGLGYQGVVRGKGYLLGSESTLREAVRVRTARALQ